MPEFLATTALAAEKGDKKKDTVLVVVELTGGNDGLNTVAPYGDDEYHKARPTLAFGKKEVQKLDDYHGLHPRLNELKQLYDQKRLAVIQGVGYPNPDRSHFESMDIWQLADPKRANASGWLARTIPGMTVGDAGVPGMYIGPDRLPVAMQGADGGVISLADRSTFKLQVSGNSGTRKKLLEDLNTDSGAPNADLAAFVRKRQLQTYTSLQKLEEALRETTAPNNGNDGEFINGRYVRRDPNDLNNLNGKLSLIGRLIQKGLGTRLYYVSLDGFDTHSNQGDLHAKLMSELGGAVGNFFRSLSGEHADRVALMTYSEFGRRVKRERQSRYRPRQRLVHVPGRVAGGRRVGRQAPEHDRPDGRRHQVPHRLPPHLRDAAGRLAGRGQQGRAGREIREAGADRPQEEGAEQRRQQQPAGQLPPGGAGSAPVPQPVPPAAAPPEPK